MRPAEPATLTVSTPGRICLFGEHQDYLDLPVISCAISLRLTIAGHYRQDRNILLRAPDLNSTATISLESPAREGGGRDYFRSGLKVLRAEGFTFSRGIECVVSGAIPIAAGTSSSSALVVSWINLLARMSDQHKELSPDECARLAYEAEVVELGGPGGRMDQYGTALGGVQHQIFSPDVRIERLTPAFGAFVLGDSLEPKNTSAVLSGVKDRVLRLISGISARDPRFSLLSASSEDPGRLVPALDAGDRSLLAATLRNRDITREGLAVLRRSPLDEHAFGELLNEQQAILRDSLRVSTPKIDRMIGAALDAGALGGKLNGSGGGGCMFVYAPARTDEVAGAIGRAGGNPYVVHCDGGTRAEA